MKPLQTMKILCVRLPCGKNVTRGTNRKMMSKTDEITSKLSCNYGFVSLILLQKKKTSKE